MRVRSWKVIDHGQEGEGEEDVLDQGLFYGHEEERL